jgi:hypothetical protein
MQTHGQELVVAYHPSGDSTQEYDWIDLKTFPPTLDGREEASNFAAQKRSEGLSTCQVFKRPFRIKTLQEIMR